MWEDPAGANYETDYQYDGLGNLVRVDQKGGSANSADWRTRQFSYDSLSRLLTASNPESGTIGYSYDSDSNVVTKDSPQPNQASPSVREYVDYCYDELHRLTAKFYRTSGSRSCSGSAAVSYAYDVGTYGKPHRSGMSDASGSTAWAYNNVGAITQEQRLIHGTSDVTKSIGYSYNLDGSLATLTYPSGRVVAYGYNAAAQPVSAIDSANSINFAKNATYAPQGALSSVLYGYTTGFAGITASASFNNRLQPTLIEAQAPSQTVLSLSYSYGAAGQNNGNVFQIQNNRDVDRSANFSYDALNRIALAWSSGALWGEHFTIDPWGNLYKIRACQSGDACNGKPQGENLDTTADQANRLVGLSYDAAGNVTNDGVHGLVTYDAENRITNVAGASYTYDGDGERVKKDAGTLYWTGTGSDPLTETDLGGTPTADYVFFGGKRVARIDLPVGSVHYYFSDHLGSADVVTNADGTVIESESDYYPYGGERAVIAGPNHYKFTGKERDSESGLDYFGARYYGSSLGRYMRPDDPFADQHPEDPQSWNLYSYVRNNPLNASDPSGNECVSNGNGGWTWSGSGETCEDVDAQEDEYRHSGQASATVNGCAGEGAADCLSFMVSDLMSTSSLSEVGVNGMSYAQLALGTGELVEGISAARASSQLAKARMAAVQGLGRSGELAAGIVRNTERISSTTGAAYRVPDILDHAAKIIGEVKNYGGTTKVYLTNQLKDDLAYAAKEGYTMQLRVREGVQLSKSVQQLVDQGKITLIRF